ncbi:MAG: hypothetical protein NT027_19445 [Proteobacteria bacterium]|nr:hypothetical protein [Pseudomonadota bacterium]
MKLAFNVMKKIILIGALNQSITAFADRHVTCEDAVATPRMRCFQVTKMLTNIARIQNDPQGPNSLEVWNKVVQLGLFDDLGTNAAEANYVSLPVQISSQPGVTAEKLVEILQSVGLSGKVYQIKFDNSTPGLSYESSIAYTDVNQVASVIRLSKHDLNVIAMPWLESSESATVPVEYQVVKTLIANSEKPELSFDKGASVEARRRTIDRASFVKFSKDTMVFLESRLSGSTSRRTWKGRITLSPKALANLYPPGFNGGNILLMATLHDVVGDIATIDSESAETITYGFLAGLISSIEIERNPSYGSTFANPMPRGY